MGMPLLQIHILGFNYVVMADVQQAGEDGDGWVLKRKTNGFPIVLLSIQIVPEMFMRVISIRWRKID